MHEHNEYVWAKNVLTLVAIILLACLLLGK